MVKKTNKWKELNLKKKICLNEIEKLTIFIEEKRLNIKNIEEAMEDEDLQEKKRDFIEYDERLHCKDETKIPLIDMESFEKGDLDGKIHYLNLFTREFKYPDGTTCFDWCPDPQEVWYIHQSNLK